KEGAGGGYSNATGQPPPEVATMVAPPRLEKAGETRSEKLVLFIDALNQLTGIAPEMHWLPDFIPENGRLILSTTPELPLESLRPRKWKELEMKPLTGTQVQAIAKNFLGEYRKQLDFSQLALLSLDEKTQRPLFLRTMLEELRVHGSHT